MSGQVRRGARGVAAIAALIAAPAAAQDRQVLPAAVTPSHYDVAIVPDAAALTFTGQVTVDIAVHAATDRITVNAADLTIDSATLDARQPLAVSLDKAAETATFAAPRAIAPGAHKLTVRWHGAITRFTSGFFALDYQDSSGAAKRMIATKFEPAAARRFMPLWDEPERKATYTLTADVPATDLAISNTAVARETPLPGGRKRVTFAPTPPMSSYLLFFASGDLERVSRRVGNVDIGVVTRRGVGARGGYALDAAEKILPFYNRFFGVDYPIAKLDLIAGPGSGSFGAMENWGAIFFFENRLLVDQGSVTEAQRQDIYEVVAHEMAHQWFGNLVTMRWWDDLWLNEGFADWMATRALQEFHPEWRPGVAGLANRGRAMRLDTLPGSHPVIQSVASGPAANQAFDDITYGKGQAVIGMIEAYVGADRFRRGLVAYMREHRYGNTVNQDLWRAIGAASGQPVDAIAAEFLTQPGVPLVLVNGGGAVTQTRLSYDPAAERASWHIPLVVQPLAGGAATRLVVPPQGARLGLKGPALLNAGQAAYARVGYDDASFAPVLRALPRLDPADQFGLLDDAWAIGQSDPARAARVIRVVQALPAAADPLVWTRAVAILAEVRGLERGTPGEAAFSAWLRARLAGRFARLGWEARAGESANDAILREALILGLGAAGDPGVLAEAKRRYQGWRRAPASLPPALVQPVLLLTGREADAATFAELRAAAKAESDPERKTLLYAAMAGVRDTVLATEMLTIATGGEAPAARAASLVSRVAQQHPDLA